MTTTKGIQLLLVEDNPNDLELTLRALKKSHLADRIHIVRNGAEALEFLFPKGADSHQEAGDPAMVILLDLKLPKVDGMEVLRQIKADPRTQMLPVVVLTSSQQDQDIAKCYQLGANSYIVKPVDFKQFADAISELGLYWLSLNQPPH